MRIATKHLLLLTLAAFLASCSAFRKGDGPPNYDVDVSRIPNAEPKPEKLAKYGNMPFYTVYGKRYYIMKSPRNFEQTGMASWYGTKFHSRRTSSGERYNMLAMTAAHKTLPLPTYVEVTNLKNNRQIIVKVNDRGPFSSNRIIDLSYVAAKKLGMLGHGTTKVKIKAIDPYQYASQRKKASTPIEHRAPATTFASSEPITTKHAAASSGSTHHSSTQVYLQAGAFSKKAYAISLKKRLGSLQDYPVRVTAPGTNSKLYRVQIGPIDHSSINKITQRLRSIGITAKKIQEV
jgi:rare lipoprotein A